MSKTIDKIDEIATHYGFKTVRAPAIHINGEVFLRPEEKISILKNYLRNRARQDNEVSMLYHNHAVLTNNRLRKKIPARFKNFNFDIIGVSNSMAEATVIHTAVMALNEEGFKNVFVDINSVGDKESFARFRNELFDYYKSHTENLHPKCKNFHKKDILNWFLCAHKECQAIKKAAPKPIYFLSDHSQKHLKEILEYLESIRINYRINDLLVSSHNYFSKSIFEIKTKNNDSDPQSEEILLGRGGRYDELAERIIRKKNMPAVGISLKFERTKNKNIKTVLCHKPKFYFIQLGPEAKLKSLPIIESFRGAKISIQQNLYTDKLSEQMEVARKLEMPYTIILGQKEAVENTVIVKNMREVTQKVIKIGDLLPYLKQLV